jgi:hypothetical protein
MSFELTPVDANFALKELEQLNPSKSTGLDGIPPRFLRDGACIKFASTGVNSKDMLFEHTFL